MAGNPGPPGGNVGSEGQRANLNEEDALYPIAILIDELRNEDVQVHLLKLLLY